MSDVLKEGSPRNEDEVETLDKPRLLLPNLAFVHGVGKFNKEPAIREMTKRKLTVNKVPIPLKMVRDSRDRYRIPSKFPKKARGIIVC